MVTILISSLLSVMTMVRHLLLLLIRSNNAGQSSDQQMIVSGNNVYVVWLDNSNGDDSDIFFRVSDDNGQTFAPFTD